MSTTNLILYSANFAFIVTHLYGWLLKWFYRPKAYDNYFHRLFPAQRAVGALYLMQVMELPYLFQVADPDALLYVNAFAVLIFPLQMLVMCEGYFFPHHQHKQWEYWIFIPAVIVILPLLLQSLRLVALPDGYTPWVFTVVTIIFVFYLALNIRMAVSIGRAIRETNENTYADSDDFPVSFAQFIQWIPTAICVLLAVNFFANDPVVKAGRDILFIGANVAFCIFTLNPWRKAFVSHEEAIIEQMEQESSATHRLSDNRYEELSSRLNNLLADEHIFTEPHITIETLMQRLGTNSKYITEVIKRSGYQSFYDMVCQHRVRHAISLIHQNPNEKLLSIADQCGFSSQASMTKAFKSQGKETPSAYREGERMKR